MMTIRVGTDIFLLKGEFKLLSFFKGVISEAFVEAIDHNGQCDESKEDGVWA